MGDCPSFVSVQIKAGTGLKKRTLPQLPAAEVALPRECVRAGEGYRIIAPGIGGTGVVTISALLATAAWIDGLNVATLDQTGTAQKGGAVVSHLLFSEQAIAGPAKVNAGNADLILGFDLLGVVSAENLKTACAEKTVAVINTDMVPTIDNVRARAPISGPGRMVDIVNATTVRGRNLFVDANRLAEALFGSHLAANIFLTGVAYQAGLIPVSLGRHAAGDRVEWRGEGQESAGVFMGPQILYRRGLGGAADQVRRLRRRRASTAWPSCAPIRATRTRESIASLWPGSRTPSCARWWPSTCTS